MKRQYYWYALVFAVIQLITIVRNYTSDYFNFFWFCDFVSILFCLAFLAKNDHAIMGLVNIGLFPQIIYVIMMIYSTSQGAPPPGMLNPVNLWYVLSSFIIHFSTLLALFATRNVKPSYKTLIYSLFSLIIIYLVTLMITSPEESVNYVYNTGAIILPFIVPYYTSLWIPLAFAVFVLPTQLLQFLIYISTRNHKKNSN